MEMDAGGKERRGEDSLTMKTERDMTQDIITIATEDSITMAKEDNITMMTERDTTEETTFQLHSIQNFIHNITTGGPLPIEEDDLTTGADST